MSKIALSGNASGTGTLTIAAPNTSTDRTLTLPNESGTVLTSSSNVAQKGVPAFSAYQSLAQSISVNTWTKVLFQTESFDTASCYNTSSSVFTPNVAGLYQISTCFTWATSLASTFMRVYKNGSVYKRFFNSVGGATVGTINGSCLIEANGTTDYFEVYIFADVAQNSYNQPDAIYFDGVLVRAA